MRRLVPQVYDAPWELRTRTIAPDGRRSIGLASAEPHPHLVLWVITLEKVRQHWPIVKPARVTVVWTRKANADEARLMPFEGMALEQADENGLRITQKADTRTGKELLLDEREDYEKQKN